MKKQILLLLSIITLGVVQAQIELSKDYSYEVSKPYRVIDGRKNYFSYENDILAIKIDKKRVYIQKFDKTKLNEISRKEYNIKDLFPKNWLLESIIQLENQVYIFYSSWNGGKINKERLFVRKINFSSGSFDKSYDKEILSVDGKITGAFVSSGFNIKTTDKFDIIKMDGISNILIQYRKKPKVKKDTKSFDIIGMNVFNVNLDKIWGNEFKMPYTERQMNLIDYVTDKDDNIYTLVKKFHDNSNKDKKKGKSNYHLELFKYSKESNEVITNKLNIGDKFISEIGLYVNDVNEIYCAGFYNDGKSQQDVGGVVIFSIDEINNVPEKSFHKISVSILNQYVKKKTKKKNNKKSKKGKSSFNSLVLRDLVFHEDGAVTIIGEQYFVTTHTYMTSNGGMRTSYTYHYNDILITKLNADGTLAWMKKIPKRQAGKSGLGGMSFTYFYSSNAHYLIYLDNVKNIKLPLDKLPALHSNGHGGYLTSCKIDDQTGEVSRGSILDTRNLKKDMKAYQYQTNRVLQTADNEFVIEVYKKKKEDVLIKVNIK